MNQKPQKTALTAMSTKEMTRYAIVTALYVAVTLLLSAFSFGAIQIRLSEMFNFLAIYRKGYIWAVSLGVFLANIYSPFGIIDMVVGTLSTFVFLQLIRWITKRMKKDIWKYIVLIVVFTLSMATIAVEISLISKVPFWATYLSVAGGELVSLIIGGLIMYPLSRKLKF